MLSVAVAVLDPPAVPARWRLTDTLAVAVLAPLATPISGRATVILAPAVLVPVAVAANVAEDAVELTADSSKARASLNRVAAPHHFTSPARLRQSQ